MEQIDIATQEVQAADGVIAGHINLGVLPTIAPYFLPHVFAQFSPQCPAAEVMFHEDMTGRLLQMMDTGDLDLGILSRPIPEHGFEIEELFTEELLLALPSSHPLAAKEAIRLEDLYSEKFILMKEGHCLGDQALVFCHRHDFRPHIAFRSSQIETIQSFVMAGLGVSLIPQMAKMTGMFPLIYRSLEKPVPSRTYDSKTATSEFQGKVERRPLRIVRKDTASVTARIWDDLNEKHRLVTIHFVDPDTYWLAIRDSDHREYFKRIKNAEP